MEPLSRSYPQNEESFRARAQRKGARKRNRSSPGLLEVEHGDWVSKMHKSGAGLARSGRSEEDLWHDPLRCNCWLFGQGLPQGAIGKRGIAAAVATEQFTRAGGELSTYFAALSFDATNGHGVVAGRLMSQPCDHG